MRYIDAYSKGLTGPDAIWANRKYRGHRTLPPNILSEIKKANSTSKVIYTSYNTPTTVLIYNLPVSMVSGVIALIQTFIKISCPDLAAKP